MQTKIKDFRNKKIIFSADDFAKCDEMDYAILKGFENNVLTNTCIMPNGANYEKAVKEILPAFNMDFRKGGLGVHLNIIEGKSLLDKNSKSLLCDSFGNYNKGFAYMLANSYNAYFLNEVEAEFRSQIEKLLDDPAVGKEKLDHINSHVHVHAIPKIFELTAKLAREYGFSTLRTQCEPLYTVPSLEVYQKLGVVDGGLNVIKNVLLNILNIKNKKILKEFSLKTNDNFIGLLFTAHMDENAILCGLKSIKEKSVTEVLVHPYLYKNNQIADVFKHNEYLLTQNHDLRKNIENLGYEFTNFSSLQ